MANRRCIDTRIVGSCQFLQMGKAAQALYFHCIAHADDDGVVEGDMVLRVTRTRKTALQELIDNGFVTVLIPSQNILWTNQWQSFNNFDTRYGQPSIYRETLKQQFPTLTFKENQRKDAPSLTSGSCGSKKKLKEKKRSEVSKNNEQPTTTSSSFGTDTSSSHDTTNDESVPTTMMTTDYAFSDDIPPVKSEVQAFFEDRVFYDDEASSNKAERQTEKFFELNKKNAWRYVRRNGLLKTLEQFVSNDDRMRDRYHAWNPETQGITAAIRYCERQPDWDSHYNHKLTAYWERSKDDPDNRDRTLLDFVRHHYEDLRWDTKALIDNIDLYIPSVAEIKGRDEFALYDDYCKLHGIDFGDAKYHSDDNVQQMYRDLNGFAPVAIARLRNEVEALRKSEAEAEERARAEDPYFELKKLYGWSYEFIEVADEYNALSGIQASTENGAATIRRFVERHDGDLSTAIDDLRDSTAKMRSRRSQRLWEDEEEPLPFE